MVHPFQSLPRMRRFNGNCKRALQNLKAATTYRRYVWHKAAQWTDPDFVEELIQQDDAPSVVHMEGEEAFVTPLEPFLGPQLPGLVQSPPLRSVSPASPLAKPTTSADINSKPPNSPRSPRSPRKEKPIATMTESRAA